MHDTNKIHYTTYLLSATKSYKLILSIVGVKYIVGLESYGPKSACFEHGEKWVQKISHKKKEEVIETQRRWGAGCYEVTKML